MSIGISISTALGRGTGGGAVVLAAPSNLALSITGASYDVITATWNAVVGATDYEVEYSDDGVTYAPVGTTALLTFDIEDTDYDIDAAVHYVRVRAVGGDDWTVAQIEGNYIYLNASYSMDEVAGNSRVNSIGGVGALAEIGGNVSSTTGLIASAADMSGANSLRVTNAIYALDNSSLFAISFWVKFTGVLGGGVHVMEIGTGSGFTYLLLQSDVSNQLRWYLQSFGGQNLINPFTVGTWYHILIGFDGTSVVAYVNAGSKIDSLETPVVTSNNTLRIESSVALIIDEVHYWKGYFPSVARRTRDYNGGVGLALR